MGAAAATPSRGRLALKSASFYSAALGFEGALKLLMLPLITRAISVDVFGNFALLGVAAPLLVLCVDLGGGTAAVRELAKRPPTWDHKTIVSTLIHIRATLAAILGLGVFGLSFLVEDPALKSVLPVCAVAVFCIAVQAAISDALRGIESHFAVVVGFFLRSTVNALVVYVLVLRGSYGLMGLVLGVLISNAAGIVWTMPFLGRSLLGRARGDVYRSLLRFGSPIAAYGAIRTSTSLDRYLVKHLASSEATGIYQVATVPTAAVEMLEFGALQAVEPYVFGMTTEERERRLPLLLLLSTWLFVAIGIGVTILGPEIMVVLAPASYAASLGAIPGLLFGSVIRVQTRLAGFAAGSMGGTRVWAISAAVDAAATFTVLLLLPWRWLPTSASWAHVGGSIIGYVCCVWLGRRVSGLRLPLVRVLGTIVPAALIAASVGTGLFMAPLALPVRLAVGGLLVVGAAVVLRPWRVG